jgi:hypothetical protein
VTENTLFPWMTALVASSEVNNAASSTSAPEPSNADLTNLRAFDTLAGAASYSGLASLPEPLVTSRLFRCARLYPRAGPANPDPPHAVRAARVEAFWEAWGYEVPAEALRALAVLRHGRRARAQPEEQAAIAGGGA